MSDFWVGRYVKENWTYTANVYSEITVDTGHMFKVYTLQVFAIYTIQSNVEVTVKKPVKPLYNYSAVL
jgi:hypothetical protein